MGESYFDEKKDTTNNGRIMELIKKYWKQAVGVILAIGVLYGVIYLATPKPQMSELDKYKLEQLDQNIQKLQKLQQSLNDSINSYQNKINEIDDKIGKIKVERKEVNNFYTQKKEEIKNADKKQIDSLLRGRYNF
jgi:septal ring factor EnvC (AmiA/AmiB activator)